MFGKKWEYRLLVEGEVLGGNLVYQEGLKEKVAKRMVEKLNEVSPEEVCGIFQNQSNVDFKLMALVKIEKTEEKK
jgi:hypothetical protein